MKYKKIEDYELSNLKKGLLYINKYDMSLMTIWELNTYWKEFFFDILKEMVKNNDTILVQQNLFDYMKKEYYNIIKDNKLKIDIRDYVEITDYISYEDWMKSNDIAFVGDEIYIVGA